MAYTTIDNPELFFQTKLYTGSGSAQSITFDGSEDMRPDWVWLKSRGGEGHRVHDSVRGVVNSLQPDGQEAQETAAISSFDSNGFSFDSGSDGNSSAGAYNSYVSWCWKAGNSSGSSNTDGSVTSTVSASTASGFSIARFTGTGSNLTIGHGLGVKPDFIILKCDSSGSTDWTCYHSSLGATKRIKLNANEAASTNSTTWQDTEPTTSLISVGTSGDVNVSSGTHIVYSFANKQGAVKCGSYTGNGDADAPFIYTGFKPAIVILKETSTTSQWYIFDNKRDTFNLMTDAVFPDLANAETTDNAIDFLSNGFKGRKTSSDLNTDGNTHIYIAFAESPFVNSNGVPNNAR